MPPLPREFFRQPVIECARGLIGCRLQWGETSGLIVETEAYSAVGDEAAHTWFRPSSRLFMESHPPGTAYVYLNYGVHWLLNFLALPHPESLISEGNGMVLIRALEPLTGIDLMRQRRQRQLPETLGSGPGKLTQALGITGSLHGRDATATPAMLYSRKSATPPPIIAGVRIGIARSRDLPWRFCWEGNRHLSR